MWAFKYRLTPFRWGGCLDLCEKSIGFITFIKEILLTNSVWNVPSHEHTCGWRVTHCSSGDRNKRDTRMLCRPLKLSHARVFLEPTHARFRYLGMAPIIFGSSSNRGNKFNWTYRVIFFLGPSYYVPVLWPILWYVWPVFDLSNICGTF